MTSSRSPSADAQGRHFGRLALHRRRLLGRAGSVRRSPATASTWSTPAGASTRRPRSRVDQYRAIGGDDGNGWQGFGGLDPVIWQFGSRIAWGSQHMDHNAFRGDAARSPPMVQGLERRRERSTGSPSRCQQRRRGCRSTGTPAADDRGRRHLPSDRRSCSPGRSTRGGRSGRSRRFNAAGDLPVTGRWDRGDGRSEHPNLHALSRTRRHGVS